MLKVRSFTFYTFRNNNNDIYYNFLSKFNVRQLANQD